MTVTKIVGFDLRIPKHFSLHFLIFLRFYMEFTSLQLLILVFMYVFHLGPWVFVSSQGKSLAEVQNRAGNGRGVSRRGESLEAWGKWGKMERGSRATFGWPWLVGRGSEEAGPQ